MYFKKLLAITLSSFVFLTACSTYSKRQCSNFDWRSRGFLSATEGESQNHGIAHYRKACAVEHDVQPDFQEFKVGYEKGLKVFCTADHARLYASRGGEYLGTCPKETEKEFLKPYITGINHYYKNQVSDLEREVSKLENEVNDLKNQVSNLESDKTSLEATCR